jgi:hemerythrin-like domain-containing protein
MDKQKIEVLKVEKQSKKKLVDEMEEETAKARRDVQSVTKDIAQLSHQISTIYRSR